MIELVVDNRERELIIFLTKNNVSFKVETLDLGDIIFKKENEIVFVIERKTLNDLKASICDGRLREQKARLMSNFEKSRIMYLIEGRVSTASDGVVSGMPISTILGSIINTLLRDDLKVYKTNSLEETAIFIERLLEKFTCEIDMFFKESKPIDYVSTLKTQKKANMTPSVWLVSQLALIPQVSTSIATEISIIYPSLISLVFAYERLNDEKQKEELLSNIKQNNGRRIGEKISKRIYQFVYNVNL
jgi:crossover junction endonuclease MUS81